MGDEASRESSKRKWFEDLKKSKAAELEQLGLDPTQVSPSKPSSVRKSQGCRRDIFFVDSRCKPPTLYV